MMRKRILYFITLCAITTNAIAATRDAQLTNTTGYNYNYMYPYMNNQMRTNLNPGVTTSQSLNPINTVVKTIPLSATRRVVPRTNTSTARTATATPQQNARRVVARRGNTRGNEQQTIVQNNTPNRSHPTNTNRSATTTTYTLKPTESISSTRCLADYTECMNGYCMRENTAYNRCYCSARLSQIDSEYQSTIDSLIKQILTVKATNKWSDDEMNEYWMDTVGKYRGENSWTNLDNALNINWAGMESRVRGQNAFATGHEYCVQHLRGCYYMAGNLRDAYRSEITRDCDTYEQSLQRLKNAAESIVESYQ